MEFKIFSNSTLVLLLSVFISFSVKAQSPKKYLKNGFYEQAFVEATYRQNKRVKLKKKHAEVIYQSYEEIYKRHASYILSSETSWEESALKFVRMTKFLAKVKHPMVFENLKNITYDSPILEVLANKFNASNNIDQELASQSMQQGNYTQALTHYEWIGERFLCILPYSTLVKRVQSIDYQGQIDYIHQLIGDDYVTEARILLESSNSSDAKQAIYFLNEASRHRMLTSEEENLFRLADLIIGQSWMEEAKNLMKSPTKLNAQLAHALIEKVKKLRVITMEEEQLMNQAYEKGMTNVLVIVKGGGSAHMSGQLNRSKSNKWVTYYYQKQSDIRFDYEITMEQNSPKVQLGTIQKEVHQSSKNVIYWEEEMDENGNVIKVKKERLAVGIFAILTRDKTASITWSVAIKDLKNGKVTISEKRTSNITYSNKYASLVSGDILAAPENIETEIHLDSQPFPSDKQMKMEVNGLFLQEMIQIINKAQFM